MGTSAVPVPTPNNSDNGGIFATPPQPQTNQRQSINILIESTYQMYQNTVGVNLNWRNAVSEMGVLGA